MVARRRFLVAGTIVTLVTVGVFSVCGGEMLGALEDGRTTGSIGLASDFPSEASPSEPAEPSTSPRPARRGADTRPEDYGAVGGDGRDDWAAVQRAVDVAARRGSVARLSRTTYRMDRALTLSSGAKLVGRGGKSVLRFTWVYNDDDHDGFYVGNRDQHDGDSRLRLRNLRIRGSGSGRPSGPQSIEVVPWVPAMRFRVVDHLMIRKVRVSHSPGISMLLQGVSDALIERNRINRSGRDGINVGWYDGPSHHVVVRRNLVRRVGDDGLAVVGYPVENVKDAENVHHVRFVGNRVLGWRKNPNGLMLGRGIAVLGGRQVKVFRNRVARTHSTGILISGATREGLHDPDTDRPWRSRRVLVEGNVVIDAGLLSEGSDPVAPISQLGGLVCQDSDRVRVKRNDLDAAVGHDLVVKRCRGYRGQGS